MFKFSRNSVSDRYPRFIYFQCELKKQIIEQFPYAKFCLLTLTTCNYRQHVATIWLTVYFYHVGQKPWNGACMLTNVGKVTFLKKLCQVPRRRGRESRKTGIKQIDNGQTTTVKSWVISGVSHSLECWPFNGGHLTFINFLVTKSCL